MIQGLYAAASGMLGIERRQDVVAATSRTAAPGFRRQVAVNEGFNEICSAACATRSGSMRNAPGGQAETFTDMQSGNVIRRLSIACGQFIAVDTPHGDATRNGKHPLTPMTPDTADGFQVQT